MTFKFDDPMALEHRLVERGWYGSVRTTDDVSAWRHSKQ